jgi:phosphoenolpyruvate carboxylase
MNEWYKIQVNRLKSDSEYQKIDRQLMCKIISVMTDKELSQMITEILEQYADPVPVLADLIRDYAKYCPCERNPNL